MKYLSIRVKLIILTLIILIPLTILQAINIRRNFNRSTDQKLQANVELAQAVSKSFVKHIEVLWEQEAIISKYIIANIDNPEKIQSYLESIVNEEGAIIKRISWVNPEGIILANTREYLIGGSIAERDYYKRILAGEEKVVSNLLQSYVDEIILFPVAKAIKKDGKLIGIVAASIDTDELLSHIPNIKLNEGDELRLIDNNGYLVYSNKDNNVAYEERKIPEFDPAWKAMNGQVFKSAKVRINSKASYKMGVEQPIEEIGWVCSVISDRSVVLKGTYEQAVQSIAIFVLVSLISLITAYIFGKKIVDPLVILKNKADELKQGDYSVRTNIGGYDEVASTAEAFDLMADSIEQYDKIKGQFFSNLSHEFRTPINVIYSSIQLIESIKDSSDIMEFKSKTIRNVECMRQNCYRLMKLVDNMIDVTRYDTGHFKMTLHQHNIVSILENISLSVVGFAEKKGVTLIFDTDVEEKEVSCDPFMIERILLNLISNSLKFTEPGGFIYINVYDKGENIIFSVRDTGIGIPEGKLSIIFDRFRQVDTSLHRNNEGSGLGLSIVKALVEAHGGNIMVKSEVGSGTEFIVELPTVVPLDYSKNTRDQCYNNSDTIQKIQIEFSDIYSI